MMWRVYVRVILGLTALLCLPVLLIRAQPYDDSEIRFFLSPPDDCDSPCFLGVRPGITSIYQAVNELGEHQWVGDVDQFDTGIRTDSRTVTLAKRVNWFWNGQQPDWLEGDQVSTLFYYPTVGRVDKIIVDTGLTVGAIQFVLGRPDVQQFATRYQVDGYWWTYEASFESANLTIRIEAPCPAGQVVQRGEVEMTFGYILSQPDQHSNTRTVCP